MPLYNYLAVKALRYMLGKKVVCSPDEILEIPSRDEGRIIKVHLYKSKKETQGPAPVLVNWHGSGWILHQHGEDDEYCKRIAEETAYTVLDMSYRLAPENPYPAAPKDAEDAIRWVLSERERFDRHSIALSGFSAGGNLALGVASHRCKSTAFKHLIAFYPPCDLSLDPHSKIAPDTSGQPIPGWIAQVFNYSYDPTQSNAQKPDFSPALNPPEAFPDSMLVFTCALDSLCLEAETLAKKVQAVKGKQVFLERLEGCNHAWDKTAAPGTLQDKQREKAYAMAVAFLNKQ